MMRKSWWLPICLLLLSAVALAQRAPDKPAPDPKADVVADEAVRDWQSGRYQIELGDVLKAKNQDEQLERLRKLARFSAFDSKIKPKVSLKLREVALANADLRRYRYPMVVGDQDATLIVTLERANGAWVPRGVMQSQGRSLLPAEIFTPFGAWAFVALSALLAWAVMASTAWRAMMRDSWLLARNFKSIVLATMLALFGLFAFGAVLGGIAPKYVEILQELAASALAENGLRTDAGVASTAFAIAFNNVRNGLLIGSFLPGCFFALPAYLYFGLMSIFYGFLLTPAGLPGLSFALHLPTILVELGAYFYVVAQSGVMLYRVIKGTGFGVAWLDYAKALPVAVTALVIAAWYESFSLLVLLPMFSR